jgi:hypothetical protein
LASPTAAAVDPARASDKGGASAALSAQPAADAGVDAAAPDPGK